ncbi:MAG: DinB family protein [Cyclobacteriaceae bacterium]|nr:DinB family protein [Cyclobacteriaceae bacterium SS2]
MHFSFNQSLEILERTPSVLVSYLSGLSDEWLKQNEGENTWSPYDILGHLIVGEKTDWMVRARIILGSAEDKRFKAFDRFAQLRNDQNRTISDMLKEFSELRSDNLEELKAFDISEEQLKLTGIHPEFGEVTMSQLLSTWTVHDLNHISHISRVMARQYKEAVGPWINYLGILKK